MTLIESRPARGSARSPGPSYQQLLDTDTRPVPPVLRFDQPEYLGDHDLEVARYTSREFHELEIEKMWKKTWQMACREEDIPEVGDTIVYDIVGISILLVRSATSTIQAFYNACLHRGRQLREFDGFTAELRCPFHGYCWNLDGSLKHIPCEWDFPHVEPEKFALPEVLVDTWGGFVFINMDLAAEPLADFVGDLTDHFDRWPLEKRFKEAHVARIYPTNWKVVQEAFMEAFHVVATHPQLLNGIGDANTQYDTFGNFSRAITPNGTPSPHLSYEPTEQQMLDAMLDRRLDDPPFMTVADGSTARATSAAATRGVLRGVLGDEAEKLCDAELVDSFYYTLFPNFHPWGAYNRIVYRFRPYGDRHDMAIMECMFMSPYSGEKPPSAKIHWLGVDDDWMNAPELGLLARVFNQDTFNLPKVQAGLKTLAMSKGTVTMAVYQETKIRHFHKILDDRLSR